jgi:hypothetical protein
MLIVKCNPAAIDEQPDGVISVTAPSFGDVVPAIGDAVYVWITESSETCGSALP